MSEHIISQLISFTRDGEWGQGEPGPGFVPMQVIRGTDFERVRFGDLSTLPIRYIREDIARRKAIKANDVLIETAGGTKDQPTGRTVHINEHIIAKARLPLICASFARFLRPDMAGVDPGYLFWKLQAEYHSGALRPFHIQHTGVARFQYTQFATTHLFAFPDDLAEQRETAEVLSDLDAQTELNRRMNETLEGMAQAIFRDWFVDFGPVRRKLAGEANPVAIMGGLTSDPARAAQLAALFPAAFGNDGLPVGWELQPVSAFAELRGGKQLEKQHILPVGPNPVFGGAGIMGYATISNATGYVITVGRVGAYCGQFFGHRGSAWVNNNASLIKPSVGVPPEWLLLALRESDIESIKRGAAQPFVSNGDVSKLPLVDAGAGVRAAFEELTRPLFLLSEARQAESRTLAETRDYLLPRLMSGEVRVAPQVEAI